MRSIAALLALAGCNSLYGLEPVRLVDAPSGSDAMPTMLALTYMVGALEDGAPTPAEFPPIEGVFVRAGATTGTLLPIPTTDGSVAIPDEITRAPWRLEYTVPGRPPVEVQWTTPGSGAHLVEPVFGRIDRAPVPEGSRYRLATTGPGSPTTFAEGRVYVTGAWLELELPRDVAAPPTVDLAAARPLDVTPAAPAAEDLVLLVSYRRDPTSAPGCLLANGVASYLAPTPLTANTVTPMSAPWDVKTPITVGSQHQPDPPAVQGRLDDATPGTASDVVAISKVGNAAHDELSMLTHERDGVPAPVMLAWVDCTRVTLDTGAVSYRDVPSVASLPRVAYGALLELRALGPGRPVLRSSIVVSDRRASTATAFILAYDVPLARAPRLAGVDLGGDGDRVDVPLGEDELVLTYDLETGSGVKPADYVDVTLFRIVGATLVPVRIYRTPDATTKAVAIEPALLERGGEYVLAIRTHRGARGAKDGEFSVTEATQSAGTVFTRTFVAR